LQLLEPTGDLRFGDEVRKMSEGQAVGTLHSRAPVVFNATLVLAIVATVFVALRLLSKWIVVKRNNSDDVFTIIAWVGLAAREISECVLLTNRY
jgi:hypothetical protein